MSLSEAKTKLILENWFRILIAIPFISFDNLIRIVIKYGFGIYRIQFSVSHKSDGIKLTEKNECVTCNKRNNWKWIFCDIEPISKGIHCFRIKVDNPNYDNFALCVSPSNQTTLLQHGQIWGIDIYGNFYPNSNIKHVGQINGCVYIKQCELDMLIDCDKGEIYYRILNVPYHSSTCYAKICQLPTNTLKGWIPYFSFYCHQKGKIKLRICEIPPSWFNKDKGKIY